EHKKRKTGSMMRCKPSDISANATARPLTGNISKPGSGPKNKTTSALGKPGNHFTPRKAASQSSRLFSNRGLGCGQASDWNPERTATDVIQTELVADFHADRFASVFDADSDVAV